MKLIMSFLYLILLAQTTATNATLLMPAKYNGVFSMDGTVMSISSSNLNGCGSASNWSVFCLPSTSQRMSEVAMWGFNTISDNNATLYDLLSGGNHIDALLCDSPVENCMGQHKLSKNFVLTVSEPGSLVLLGIGVLSLSALRHRLS